MQGPLSGVRVIDMTTVLMGPYASQLLGDMGADVVKVESPQGDLVRGLGPMRNPGMGSIFLHVNRSKRAITIDAKQKEGYDILCRLLEDADVLLYNLRPKSMARLGLSYEAVAKINPRLLYVGTFGFGQGGRYADKPAYDDLIQGAIGLPSWIKRAGASVPRYVPSNIVDRTVGLYAVSAISSALYYREKTGKGQRIDVPMFETMLSHLVTDHMAGLTFDPNIGGAGYARLLAEERRPYQTKDGYVCAVIYSNKQWRAFYRALGREADFDQDARLQNLDSRNSHMAELQVMLSGFFREKTTAQWLEILEEADIPSMPLPTLETIFDDPHLTEVGFFGWRDHPTEGRIRDIGVPATWSASQPAPSRPAPRFGQHTREVLQEAGYTPDEIQHYLESGIAYDATQDKDEA